MKRLFSGAAAFLLLASASFCQVNTAKPEFEVGVIKLNKSPNDPLDRSFLGGLFTARNVPLKMLLGYAFNEPSQLLTGFPISPPIQRLQDSFIVGGPRWLDTDRFDISAKAAPTTSEKVLPAMLRVLLEKNLNLATHKEERPTNVYALVLGKGDLKVRRAVGSEDGWCRRIVGGGDDPAAKELSPDYAGYSCVNMTMADFAAMLPRLAPAYFDRVVVDTTGLTGTWDISFLWVAKNLIDQGGLDVFGAINKLGLKLEDRKAPMSYTIVDHVEEPPGN